MYSASSRRENNTISVPCTGVTTVGVNKGYFVYHGLKQQRMLSVL